MRCLIGVCGLFTGCFNGLLCSIVGKPSADQNRGTSDKLGNGFAKIILDIRARLRITDLEAQAVRLPFRQPPPEHPECRDSDSDRCSGNGPPGYVVCAQCQRGHMPSLSPLLAPSGATSE